MRVRLFAVLFGAMLLSSLGMLASPAAMAGEDGTTDPGSGSSSGSGGSEPVSDGSGTGGGAGTR